MTEIRMIDCRGVVILAIGGINFITVSVELEVSRLNFSLLLLIFDVSFLTVNFGTDCFSSKGKRSVISLEGGTIVFFIETYIQRRVGFRREERNLRSDDSVFALFLIPVDYGSITLLNV